MKLLGEEKCSFCPWGHLPVYFPPLDDYHSRRETFIWKSREYERERSQSPKRSPKQSAGKASRNDFFEVDTKQRSCPEVLSSWRVLTIRLRTSTTSGILFKKEHFKCEWKRGSEEQVYQTYNCIQRCIFVFKECQEENEKGLKEKSCLTDIFGNFLLPNLSFLERIDPHLLLTVTSQQTHPVVNKKIQRISSKNKGSKHVRCSSRCQCRNSISSSSRETRGKYSLSLREMPFFTLSRRNSSPSS